ncbi:unnamed protein product [Paramecium sonneborni]|uniref:Uncharacterized protein n=1 Tax=Paramecium sonneborni TaxID=65129 RepID=A0A8S1QQX3_9CILI|nr:unnamed protein product [Paramecium sonneborni]
MRLIHICFILTITNATKFLDEKPILLEQAEVQNLFDQPKQLFTEEQFAQYTEFRQNNNDPFDYQSEQISPLQTVDEKQILLTYEKDLQPQGECVILYAECEFKGTSKKICKGVEEVLSFSLPVFSIYIPELQQFSTIDINSNSQVTFLTSDKCLDQPIVMADSQLDFFIAKSMQNWKGESIGVTQLLLQQEQVENQENTDQQVQQLETVDQQLDSQMIEQSDANVEQQNDQSIEQQNEQQPEQQQQDEQQTAEQQIEQSADQLQETSQEKEQQTELQNQDALQDQQEQINNVQSPEQDNLSQIQQENQQENLQENQQENLVTGQNQENEIQNTDQSQNQLQQLTEAETQNQQSEQQKEELQEKQLEEVVEAVEQVVEQVQEKQQEELEAEKQQLQEEESKEQQQTQQQQGQLVDDLPQNQESEQQKTETAEPLVGQSQYTK